MLTLRVLGGLALNGPDGPVTGRAAQRRRLALLAILAHAEGRPVSRDKLIGLLWPETDDERARHALADSIYVLRTALGDEVLLTAGDDVSLNRERISSDVEAFQRALDTGDLESAVDVYARGGPFLDGIHLSESPEFEWWVDSARSQLGDSFRQALEELAKSALQRGDREAAVARWRQLAGADRLSSRVAHGLMRALADAGDVAGALDFFRVHERIVQAELEAEPDPSVSAFAEELRAGIGAATRPSLRPRPTQAPPGMADASSQPTSPARRRRAPYAAAVAVLLGATFLGRALWRPGPNGSPATADPSIVVLPLEATNAEDGPLGDGLADELIGMIASTGRLRVISRTSAFAFKGHHLEARRIADSLGVTHVLEGSLRRFGTRLRVQMQLVDGRSGTTLWTETYDRETQDVFAVQAEIAGAVARQLDVQLAANIPPNLLRHQTRNILAYELFLRANDPLLLLTASGTQRSLEYLHGAIAADSAYAAAHAGLAYQYTALGFEGTTGEPRRSLYRRAEAAALEAVALDDSLAEAHLALGFVRMRMLDFSSARVEFDRALALGPTNALMRPTLLFFYGSVGRYASALAEAERARQDDPLSPVAEVELARALLLNDRCDEALAQLDRVAAARPTVRRAAIIAARCHIKSGDWTRAITELRSITPEVRQQALLAYALARDGQHEAARQVLDSLLLRWKDFQDDAFEVAVALAGLGEQDAAFTWLDRSLEDFSLGVESVETALDLIREDPRWDRLRARVGLPPGRPGV